MYLQSEINDVYHQTVFFTYSLYCVKSQNTEDNFAEFKSAKVLNMLRLIKVQRITE